MIPDCRWCVQLPSCQWVLGQEVRRHLRRQLQGPRSAPGQYQRPGPRQQGRDSLDSIYLVYSTLYLLYAVCCLKMMNKMIGWNEASPVFSSNMYFHPQTRFQYSAVIFTVQGVVAAAPAAVQCGGGKQNCRVQFDFTVYFWVQIIDNGGYWVDRTKLSSQKPNVCHSRAAWGGSLSIIGVT